MEPLGGKRVLVTGGGGFIGQHLLHELTSLGAMIVDHKPFGNLLSTDIKHVDTEVDVVIHLAGYNGGIAFNQTYPYDIFSRNTSLAFKAIDLAMKVRAKSFIGVLTSCGYPPDAGMNILEETYLEGQPHESISSHGYAKRNLLLACQFANAQYGLNAVCLCPNTVYGPGDCLDPTRTKVMMAMVKRFVDAERSSAPYVECWGTGSPVREFIYVKDVAQLITHSIFTYKNVKKPLNLSTGQSASIKHLAELVASHAGYVGEIRWDSSKPDGQSSKVLNSASLRGLFPTFEATSLEKGISETIDWYRSL